MKKLLLNLLCGKDNRINGLIALAIVASIALGCNCGKGIDFANLANDANRGTANADTEDPDRDPDMPDDRLLKALVKETTADFSYAISTEDFSKMYSKASKDFQEQYTADQMKDVFKSAIANKRQLLPMLAKIVSMDPTYSPDPYVRKEQGVPILVVTGKYDLKPKPLGFNYEYVKRGGQYKLLKLILE